MVTASFIIPALNEEKHLARCLSSIRDLERPASTERVDVVVVDNFSTDGTAAVARSHGARVLQVEPGCISRARNVGANAAEGSMLAFVDADCELDPNWLVRMTQHLDDPTVVAAGSVLAPPLVDAPWVESIWYRLAHGTPRADIRQVAWLASFNLCVRKEAFLAVGGFDEKLITCEDVDLSYRLSPHGRLLQDGTVPTRHHGESKRLGELFRREAWRGRGSLRSLVQSRFAWRELRSVALPPAFALLGVAGITTLACGAVARDAAVTLLGGGILGSAAGVPGLAAMRKLAPPRRAIDLARAWVLLSAYLGARSLGLFRAAKRVSRR